MAYEKRDMSGILFKNKDKEDGDRRPEYTGNIMIGGIEYWLSAWVKMSSSGNKFMSLAVKAKDEQKPVKAQRVPGKPQASEDMDDSIPF